MSNIKSKDFFPEESQLEQAIDRGLSEERLSRFNRYTDDVLIGRWWEVFPIPKREDIQAEPVVEKKPDRYQKDIETIELFRTGKIDFEETKKRLGWT